MDIREAYNLWATQYDSNYNKTRDLEAAALRRVLAEVPFEHCLEIGCGTGKNTEWLQQRAKRLTAVDLSEQMLARARAKVEAKHVNFVLADITSPWTFGTAQYDLVSFSLVLEHVKDLEPVFIQAAEALGPGGWVYAGELHPFKQYQGSKARFETKAGMQIVNCFNHHISDFTGAAKNAGFALADLQEFFDDESKLQVPRILAMLFRKSA